MPVTRTSSSLEAEAPTSFSRHFRNQRAASGPVCPFCLSAFSAHHPCQSADSSSFYARGASLEGLSVPIWPRILCKMALTVVIEHLGSELNRQLPEFAVDFLVSEAGCQTNGA